MMSVWVDAKNASPPARGGESPWRVHSKRVLCMVHNDVNGSDRMEVGDFNHYSGQWSEFEQGEYRGTSRVTHWMPLPDAP